MAASNSPAKQLITENIDIWTSAIKKRGSQGRGSNKKIELYGIKKLRELILELAVRGLLVPQDPNNEPASVLLEKIAAEKEQLIKDGKIKKQKALPEISEDERPFELPNGWLFSRLGEIAVLRSGVSFAKDRELETGKYPYCKVGDMNITENTVELTTSSRFIDPLDKDIYQLIPSNSIVFPKRGGAIATNKKRYVKKPLFVDLNVMAATPIGNLSLKYFMTWLESIDLATLNTGTSVPQINNKDILPLIFPIPPVAEQPRIVAKVDELMALCDQLEQQTKSSLSAHQTLVETLLNTLLNADQNSFDPAWERIAQHFDVLFTTEHSIDQLKQTILQLAVMGKLVPQDPNDEPASVLLEKIAAEKEQLIKDKVIKKQKPLPPISEDASLLNLPVGWTYAYMQDITKVVTCGMASTPKYQEKGRIFLSAKNIKPNRFMPDDHKLVDEETFRKITQNAFPERGDILLTRVGAGIGEAAVIDCDIEFAFYVSLTLVKPFLAYLNSNYLLVWLNSPQGVKKSLDNVYGAGVSQGNLNVNQVRGFVVQIPPLEEQDRIVARTDELIALCDILKERISESRTTQLHLADAMAEQALNS